MGSLNTNAVEMVCNAHLLTTSLKHAEKFGLEMKLKSNADGIMSYELLVGGKVEENLDYCACCKRALVDSSYCDGCDQDEEDDFNRGDWL